MWHSAKKAMKTSKAADVFGLRRRTRQRRSRRVVDEAMKEIASSAALAVSLLLPSGLGLLLEGDAGSGSRKGFTFIRMWTSLLDCHQKQLQALVDCKRHSLVMKSTSQWKSAVKVTKELELELLNWCNCFHDWVNIQKSFVEALNGWQMKWLPQEQELTPDGPAPFSPTRIGAPSIFIISNDWYHAIKCISGEKVIETMRAFMEIVHMVWEIQDEEQHHRLEEEHLSQIFDRKLKSWQAIQKDQLEIVTDINDGPKHHDDSLMALDLMKQRLDEKRAIHKETLERLQTTTSNILPTGLVPTFEELGTFLSEALQAYKGIRIKNDSGGT
ncbi:hypothetical protein BHE74_00006224 [Ensete ventricosum]|nr:hypothetical protein BHE74_00006224 [Ensete ventricosum]